MVVRSDTKKKKFFFFWIVFFFFFFLTSVFFFFFFFLINFIFFYFIHLFIYLFFFLKYGININTQVETTHLWDLVMSCEYKYQFLYISITSKLCVCCWQVHMEGYQVSHQCEALVSSNCLLPTLDCPQLAYVKESSAKQYVPDVFFKVGYFQII